MRAVRLSNGNLELWLAPQAGGSIARFDLVQGTETTPILRPRGGAAENILHASSFPLVPFCSRIRDGRFSFRGHAVRIAPNLSGEPLPLHGHGWTATWRVLGRSESQAELVHVHPAGDWPWKYEARQLFRLERDALDLTLSCRNLSHEPMPCGLGQHPYFSCDDSTHIQADVSHAWTIDRDVLPVLKVPADGRYDLKDRRICAQDLDNGFEGWGGTLRIHKPGQPAVTLRSSDARFLHLYSPPSGGSFAAEPMSHRGAALNEPEESWAEAGLRILDPGEEMALRMRIEVETFG